MVTRLVTPPSGLLVEFGSIEHFAHDIARDIALERLPNAPFVDPLETEVGREPEQDGEVELQSRPFVDVGRGIEGDGIGIDRHEDEIAEMSEHRGLEAIDREKDHETDRGQPAEKEETLQRHAV